MSQKIENGQITRLVWEINTFPNYIDEGDKLLSAKTPFGFYKIMDKRPYGLSGFSYFGPYSEAHSLEDENAAKAAAEDDYEMRILSAITQQEMINVAVLVQRPEAIEKIAKKLVDDDAENLDCEASGAGDNCRAAAAALRALMIENAELRQQKDAAEDQAKAYLDAVTDAWANNELIRARLTELRGELNSIEEMFDEGQGDDDGVQVLPDFTDDMSTSAKVEACLHLLERRRDVITSWT